MSWNLFSMLFSFSSLAFSVYAGGVVGGWPGIVVVVSGAVSTATLYLPLSSKQ